MSTLQRKHAPCARIQGHTHTLRHTHSQRAGTVRKWGVEFRTQASKQGRAWRTLTSSVHWTLDWMVGIAARRPGSTWCFSNRPWVWPGGHRRGGQRGKPEARGGKRSRGVQARGAGGGRETRRRSSHSFLDLTSVMWLVEGMMEGSKWFSDTQK